MGTSRKNYNGSAVLSVWKPVFATFYFACLAVINFGVPHLAQKYSIYTGELHKVTDFMSTLATIHILILLLYFASLYTAEEDLIFGFLLIAMTICGTFFGIRGILWTNEIQIASKNEAITLASDHVQAHQRIPHWLRRTQMAHQCCGIYGFKDYRAFIYNGNQGKFVEDVPVSCCHSASQARQNKCYLHSRVFQSKHRTNNANNKDGAPFLNEVEVDNDVEIREGITNLFLSELKGFNSKSLDRLHPSDEIIAKLYPHTVNVNEDDENVLLLSTSRDDNLTYSLEPKLLDVDSQKVGSYHSKGCFPQLLDQTRNLILTYIIFLLSTMLISWILLIDFVSQNKKILSRCCSFKGPPARTIMSRKRKVKKTLSQRKKAERQRQIQMTYGITSCISNKSSKIC